MDNSGYNSIEVETPFITIGSGPIVQLYGDYFRIRYISISYVFQAPEQPARWYFFNDLFSMFCHGSLAEIIPNLDDLLQSFY